MPLSNRQFGSVHLISGDGDEQTAEPLKPLELSTEATKRFDEGWLQDLIFRCPELLPVNEIEPVFGDLIPVCRELPTQVGPLDVVYVNSLGMLTLVECKLWRNPEARRQVVGQILDYANSICRWSYADLQGAVRRALREERASLFEIVGGGENELSEPEFVDNVSRNLKRGRFLLMIVGDGIRESVELISDYLQEHAHLNFSFALVEERIYQLPESQGSRLLVQPRIIARTVEIERAVVRIDDGKIVCEASKPKAPGDKPSPKRSTITEQVFYEELGKIDPDLPGRVRSFFERVRAVGLRVELQRGAAIRSPDGYYHFGAFYPDGTAMNWSITNRTNSQGIPEVGEEYLDRLAALFPGSIVMKGKDRNCWTVKRDQSTRLTIADFLGVQDSWLDLIDETLAKIEKALD